MKHKTPSFVAAREMLQATYNKLFIQNPGIFSPPVYLYAFLSDPPHTQLCVEDIHFLLGRKDDPSK
jgi:hypothetical protein